jgi:hypothetical protein
MHDIQFFVYSLVCIHLAFRRRAYEIKLFSVYFRKVLKYGLEN